MNMPQCSSYSNSPPFIHVVVVLSSEECTFVLKMNHSPFCFLSSPCSHHFRFPLHFFSSSNLPPPQFPTNLSVSPFLSYLPTPSCSLPSLSSSSPPSQLLELNCLGLYWTTFAQSLATLPVEEMVVSGGDKLSKQLWRRLVY